MECNELIVIRAPYCVNSYLVANKRINFVYQNLLLYIPPHNMYMRLSLFKVNCGKIFNIFNLHIHAVCYVANVILNPVFPIVQSVQSSFSCTFGSKGEYAMKYIPMWCRNFTNIFLHFDRAVTIREFPVDYSKKTIFRFSKHFLRSTVYILIVLSFFLILALNIISNKLVGFGILNFFVNEFRNVLPFTHVFNKISFVRWF